MKSKLLTVSVAMVLLAGGARLLGDNTVYTVEIAKWRKNYDRDLQSEKGPLWLIARHNVPEGRTEIGSDASNRIALPGRAPKRVGAIERGGDKVSASLFPASPLHGHAMLISSNSWR